MTDQFNQIYYERKYNLTFKNKDEAVNHYNTIGKKQGFFLSLQAEIYYCKSVNFDATYYKKKYNLDCDDNTAKKHWVDTGFKQKYMVNMCEEKGEHITNCKCQFKNIKQTKNNSLQTQVEQVLNTAKKEYIFRSEPTNDSDCDCSECINENNIPNISNIKEYLNMCKKQLTIITKLLQQSKQYISDICNPVSNYIIYNDSRIKLQKTLKEINNIVLLRYNNLPLFYDKKTTSIMYPLYKSGNKETFKIKLLKISLKQLKLDKYILPLLNKGEIITNKTNIIPPSECPIGKNPTKDMYIDETYHKYWSPGYHMQLINDASYYVQMQTEIFNNNITLLETKYNL